MRCAIAIAALLVAAAPRDAVAGGPFGLAQKPAMGWRSWNCFHANVNQQKMELIVDKLTQRNRTVDGKPTSLADIGYAMAGLDDNWQACNKGVNGSFFGPDGSPLINTDLFPDMKKMVAYGHAKGVKMGWYFNNCICNVKGLADDFVQKVYEQSVKMLVDLEYDGVKLDGCSQFHNTSLWASLLNATGRPVLIENCHNSQPAYPVSVEVEPYNWFRSSTDINPSWNSIMNNLQTVTAYQGDPPLSRPTCWAYPDMLEVGNMASYEEDRAHFGAWCIVSSPLILGLDLTDEATTSSVWDIITNKEAISVNQQWAGHPGKLVKEFKPAPPSPPGPPDFGPFAYAVACNSSDKTQQGWSYDAGKSAVVGPRGLCLDGSNSSQVMLKTCDGSAGQQWSYSGSSSSAAQIDTAKDHTRCVDVWEGAGSPGGPKVQVYPCHGGKNELWTFKNGMLQDEESMCLASRATVPAPPPPKGGNRVQLWSKPQPDGAMAVLFLSSLDGSVPNATYTANFSDLGISGKMSVRDIWQHKDLGDATDALTTDAFGGKDSRFYLLTPASAGAQ